MSKKKETEKVTPEVSEKPEIKDNEKTDELPNDQVTDLNTDVLPDAQATDVNVVNLPFTPELVDNVKLEESISVGQDEILVYKVNHAISTGAFKVLCEMAKIEQEILGREIIVVPFSAVLKKAEKE